MPEESEVTFICEKCGAEYLDEESAKECEALPVPEPKFKVGDRVVYKRTKEVIKGFWWWKKTVLVEEEGWAEVQYVCGPYPPHPLAKEANDLPWAKLLSGGKFFPMLFVWRSEEYREKKFGQGSHIYFYGLKVYYTEWFFEEELRPAF